MKDDVYEGVCSYGMCDIDNEGRLDVMWVGAIVRENCSLY